MDIAQLRRYLDDPVAAAPWLRSLGVVDASKAHGNLLRLATSGLTLDLFSGLCDQLGRHLGGCADPDMAMNNLERFVAATRSPLAVGTLFDRDPQALPILVQIFSTSQHLSDLLVADPESYDLLRLTEGRPYARQALVEELTSEVKLLEHERAILGALRRFKRRETLRISYGDIVRGQALGTVTMQISYLADALMEAALEAAWRKVTARQRPPQQSDGRRARFVVLALGKLGGVELNYSSDIDLMFLYDGDADPKVELARGEFFERLAREFVHLLTETKELGAAYRVDLRLRPEGERGPMVNSLEATLGYYDFRGRTWERQAMIKARSAAGDLDLGFEFLERLRPWIYRRYLSRADITGIKALKRRIEKRARDQEAAARDVKSGHGGIRDVEFVIQFLQLLNGGDLPEVHTANTLEAIARLESAGCLTNLERGLLVENYGFLRKIEHRLQIMFDLQTHLLPDEPEELRKLALRMGYVDSPKGAALADFMEDYRSKTELNRRILDHILHDAFRGDDDTRTEAEVDLVLDPDPPEERIAEVLGPYPFRNVKQAYRNLMALSEEKIRFLSTRRCRPFLASIAPQLLKAIASTPDPDSTLVNLDKVSESLGGKGVLWELFNFNPPSLALYVQLCAYSPYLSGILTSNPGMIDGLMDSLVLDKLPSRKSLRRTLADLCRAAEDLDPILHSFKNDQQLRVGVRDILGKEDLLATTGALSDIAEACLDEIAAREYEKLAAKFGRPTVAEGRRADSPCEMAIVAMGKFGGREMNYHSDLDVVFLYESDGHTLHPEETSRKESTTNQHFFSELGQRIIQKTSRLSAYGRLYEVDARLRPTGRSGPLATSLDEFAHYFAEGRGQLWERQALCKARVVLGSDRLAKQAGAVIARAAFEHRWRRSDADEIRRMRHRLEEAAAGAVASPSSGSAPTSPSFPRDLKRGPGGIVDIEFLVQMLQLKHGRRTPEVRTPNTLAALDGLHGAGCLDDHEHQFFTASYRFLRTLEGRLRLMNATARDELPDDATERAKLAHLMRSPSADALLADLENYTRQTRAEFDRIFDAEGA